MTVFFFPSLHRVPLVRRAGVATRLLSWMAQHDPLRLAGVRGPLGPLFPRRRNRLLREGVVVFPLGGGGGTPPGTKWTVFLRRLLGYRARPAFLHFMKDSRSAPSYAKFFSKTFAGLPKGQVVATHPLCGRALATKSFLSKLSPSYLFSAPLPLTANELEPLLFEDRDYFRSPDVSPSTTVL